jgi:hypothetical protein
MMIIAAAFAPQGDVSKTDIVIGIAILAVLLPIFYVIGRTVARVKNYWFSRKWAPLVPVLEGATITKDGGVAVTSRLSGRYGGANVFALMSPNVQRHQFSSGNGNEFTVAVRDVAGAQDWSIHWSAGLPVVGGAGWSVSAADAALAARLTNAGVISMIESFGPATIRYETRDSTLRWTAFIEPWIVLPPDRFRGVMNALMDVALASR